ncbi:MAG: protoglobin family protein [Dehalococcoidia bacterium]
MTGMVDWAGRMKQMMDFVGLEQVELELVRATAPLVLKHAEFLTGAVYEHFLNFAEARKFFVTEEGEPDQERLARRKHSLARWLAQTLEANVEEGFPVQLLMMGLVHSHPPSHRAHLGSIPSRLMIGTISFAQTALAQLLGQEIADAEEAARASVAWNKLLMVQLDVLLAGYVTETPSQPQPMTAQ